MLCFRRCTAPVPSQKSAEQADEPTACAGCAELVRGRGQLRAEPPAGLSPRTAGRSPRGDAGLFEVRPTQPTGEASVGRAFAPGDDSGILALASKVEAAEAGAIAHRAFYVKSPR